MLGKTYTEAINDLTNIYMRYIAENVGAANVGKTISEIQKEFGVSLTIIKLDMEKQLQYKLTLQSSVAAKIKEQDRK